MERNYKKPAIVFLILNLVFLIAWIVGLLLIGLNSTIYPDLVQDFLMGAHLQPIINVFAFDFTKWQTYAVLAVCAIAAIMLIVGIILTITRQRKRYMFYVLPFLLSVAAAVDAFASFDNYLGAMTKMELSGKLINEMGVTLVIVLLAGAGLAYVAHFFVYFFGLLHAKALKQAAAEEELPPLEEQPAQPEEQPEENEEAPLEDEEEDFALAAVASEPQAAEEVKPEEQQEEKPMDDFAVEPEELPAQPEEVVVEELPQDADPNKAPVNKDDLASILRDVVRDIVRDEIARANAEKEQENKEGRPQWNGQCGMPAITGATFGGPLVVQYFNGGINAPTEPVAAPAPAPAAPAPAPEPVPAEEPKKEEEPAPAPAEEPAPAPEAVEPVVGPVVEEKPKNPIIRIPFVERLLDSEQDVQDIYNELKNELLSWGLHSRVSNSGDAFRLHTKTYCKITVAGKSIKLYLALDPKDYADSTLPIQDASEKGLYVDIPLVFKVKSGLSIRRAKQLIKDACEKDGLVQEEVGTVNWIKELKAEQKAKK